MSFSSGALRDRFTYRPELDGVRAIAVLMVLSFHTQGLGMERRIAGYLGVDVFFVLSGFLITTLLLQEQTERGTIALRSFYARRALRLLPALAVMIGVAWLVLVAIGDGLGTFPRAVLYVATYVGNVFALQLGILSHAWSLAIEEQFYLLWPAILVIAHRRRISRKVLALGGLAVVIAVAVFSIAWWPTPPVPVWFIGESSRFRTPTELTIMSYLGGAQGIVLGCVVALMPRWTRWTRATWIGSISGATALVLMFVHGASWLPLYRTGLSLFVFLTALTLAHVVHNGEGAVARVLSFRPLVAVGRVSYGLYLFHLPVFFWVAGSKIVAPGARSVVLAIGLTAAITVASYGLVEGPALRLKDRFQRLGPLADPADVRPTKSRR